LAEITKSQQANRVAAELTMASAGTVEIPRLQRADCVSSDLAKRTFKTIGWAESQTAAMAEFPSF